MSRLGALYIALCLQAFTLTCNAASKVQIDSTLGFADTFRLGYWAPVNVTVSNDGADLIGNLELSLTYGDELSDTVRTKVHSRSLSLSRGSRKRFRFTVYLDSFAHPIAVRVLVAGREVAVHEIDLRQRFTEGQLVLVVSRDANLDYINDGTGDSLRVLYPHPELLPDHWLGYDGVSAVVVHGVSLEHLSARQFDALKKWIAQGGKLTVSGGSDYSLLRTPRLAELLPASPIGLVTISDAAALGNALGDTLESSSPFHIQRLTNVRGNVLRQLQGLPLVVRENVGLGSVTYLSFDIASYPFAEWPAMARFWFSTLDVAPALHRTFERREIRHMSPVPSVINWRSGGFPKAKSVLLFVVLYLGVVATVYRLKPNNAFSHRALPCLVVATPLLFAPTAYALFGPLLFPLGSTAVVTSVIEPFDNGPYARLNLDVGLFANRQQSLRLEFGATQPGLVANTREERWGKSRDYRIDEDTTVAFEPLSTQAYVLHLMQGEDIILYDVNASVAVGETGLQFFVRNNTGHDWLVAWGVFEDQLYRLERLRDGDDETVVHVLGEPLGKLDSEVWEHAFGRESQPTTVEQHMARVLLKSALQPSVDNPALTHTTATLIAAVPSPISVSTREGPMRREELALVVFEFELSARRGRRGSI